MKRPWFSFYVSDWLAPGDARRMTAEERGVYVDLLAYQWERGFIPAADIEDPALLARTSNVSTRKFRAIWANIRHKFEQDSSGNYVNSRLRTEHEKVESRSDSQREKIEKRWNNNEGTDTTVSPQGSVSPIPVQSQSESHSDSQSQLQIPIPCAVEPRAPGKAKKKSPPGTQNLIAYYCDRWLETQRPADGKHAEVDGQDSAAAGRLVGKHGLVAAKDFVDRFLADQDKHIAGRGYLLRDITSRVNAYRSSRAGPRGNVAPTKHEDFGETRDATKEYT